MNTEKKQNGLGIAGMILGIVAVVTSCFVRNHWPDLIYHCSDKQK